MASERRERATGAERGSGALSRRTVLGVLVLAGTPDGSAGLSRASAAFRTGSPLGQPADAVHPAIARIGEIRVEDSVEPILIFAPRTY